MNSSINYRHPGAWQRLAAALAHDFEPRPTANCGYVECRPGWSWRPRLSDYDLWFALRGSGELRLGERRYPIRPGTLFLLRPGDTGWASQNPDDRLAVIYIHLDFHAPGRAERVVVDDAWLPARHVPFHDTGQLEPLLTRVVRLVEQGRDLAWFEARLALQQALVEVYRQDAANSGALSPRADLRLSRVSAYLHSHPETRLSLRQAAELAGLSPGHFSRRFSDEFGVSFRDYALRARLERACHLLDETDMSIAQIATALGYSDIFLFSRQFKRRYGYSPSRARGLRVKG
jgi:AraC-like DNA-binding protein